MRSSVGSVPYLASTSRLPSREETKLGCPICLEKPCEQEAITLSCGHLYDAECFRMLVKSSLGADSNHPARCCGVHLPFDLVEQQLSAEIAASYALKYREHTTQDRVYCADPSCAQFLGPLDAPESKAPSQHFRCPRASCRALTCSACRKRIDPENTDHICVLEDDGDLFEALRDGEGWIRCPGCRIYIEKEEGGCSTLVCRCGTRFCYTCSRDCRQCTCRMPTAADVEQDPLQIPLARFSRDPDFPTLHELHEAHRWTFVRRQEEQKRAAARAGQSGIGRDHGEEGVSRGGERVSDSASGSPRTDLLSSATPPSIPQHLPPPRAPPPPLADHSNLFQWLRPLSGVRRGNLFGETRRPASGSHTSASDDSMPVLPPAIVSTMKFTTHPFEQLLHSRSKDQAGRGDLHHADLASPNIPRPTIPDAWTQAYSSDPGIEYRVFPKE